MTSLVSLESDGSTEKCPGCGRRWVPINGESLAGCFWCKHGIRLSDLYDGKKR